MKKQRSLLDSKDEQELSGLMVRAQIGDGQAYNQLLIRIEKMLQSFVRKSISGDMADDVIQEIILGVHAKRHTFNAEQFFLPWFYAIAKYKVIDFIRTKTRREVLSFTEEDFNQLQVSDVDGLVSSFNIEDLEKLLTDLPDKQRAVIKAVKIDGLSVKEAALKMRLSESDVKVSIHRALQNLRVQFQGRRQ